MIKKYDGELLLTPCPTVLVTSSNKNIENVFTVSWTGIASSHPEHICIAINPKRLSYALIKETKKFCINIPSEDLLESVDFCGNNSGRDIDKFAECNLTKQYVSDYILIKECKMHILCDVIEVLDLGSHHLFVAKVFKKFIEESYSDDIYSELKPIAYYRPYYYRLEKLGLTYYGYTNKIKDKEKN